MLLKSVRGFTPKYGKDCFFAENATVIGQVIMGDNCSVWFQAVIRGDVNAIIIGDRVNIQDGAVIHGTYMRSSTKIGNDVLIGSNSTILPVKIVSGCVIGAGSVVTKDLLEKGIYCGNPAKFIRKIDEPL